MSLLAGMKLDGAHGVNPDPALCDFLGGWLNRDRIHAQSRGFAWMIMPRHGKRPVAFLGREMLRADDSARLADGAAKLPSLWHDLRVFELPHHGFVVVLRHVRVTDGLPDWQDAWACTDTRSIVQSLRAHDPAVAVRGGVGTVSWDALLDSLFDRGGAA